MIGLTSDSLAAKYNSLARSPKVSASSLEILTGFSTPFIFWYSLWMRLPIWTRPCALGTTFVTGLPFLFTLWKVSPSSSINSYASTPSCIDIVAIASSTTSPATCKKSLSGLRVSGLIALTVFSTLRATLSWALTPSPPNPTLPISTWSARFNTRALRPPSSATAWLACLADTIDLLRCCSDLLK